LAGIEMICKDCQEIGHVNKSYYKCKFYREVSANDGIVYYCPFYRNMLILLLFLWEVGPSIGTKRKESLTVKADKQKAKRQKLATNISLAVCSNCKQKGRSTSRSRECPNHIPSKTEVFEVNFGSQCRAFTRKLPLDTIINDKYKEVLKNKYYYHFKGSL
jgi:hypothetical protein